MANSIASRWRELSGENYWQGLLQPIDIDLRRYIIHYGERIGAVGDLFNSEKESSGFRHSLYPKEEVFSRACLEKGNIFKYYVTDFFYAASDDVESAWFGYVAVTTDEGKVALGRREILVAWRGTITDSEWFNNVNFFQTSASELFGAGNNAKVHSGFLSLYTGTSWKSAYNKTSAREQVLKAVRELVNKYQDEEISITVTGYSLGAALATLNAMDIVANGYNKPTGDSKKSCMVTAFAYAGPRVGNSGLEEVFKTLNDHLRLLRITNFWDPVHHLPSKFLSGYTHLGKELQINTSKSDYLKRKLFVISTTNLQDNTDSIYIPPPGHLPAEYLDGNMQVEEELEMYAATKGYKHKSNIREELEIDATTLGFTGGLVGYLGELFIAHALEVYLHGIAGVQENGFRLEIDRDIALVNKHLDWLKVDYKIPPKWWNNENRKNMVQIDNGHWKFVENA
ncbi:phospholipase A1-II 1-like [Durio zibethinus]|uniref:Phospholipase A1 n=1 Tax=Durio zibethinus TaxID=66656 RepID=A0A6P6BJT7_DURZI|nr:phospholipase A1-II 1-like [Durio zibethinus]